MPRHVNDRGKAKVVYRSPNEAIRACINISRRTGAPHNFYPCTEGGIGRHWHLTRRRGKRRG